MGRVGTYLNFEGTAEEAFDSYRAAFGTELSGGITRMGDLPRGSGTPPISDAERSLVAHIELPIPPGMS